MGCGNSSAQKDKPSSQKVSINRSQPTVIIPANSVIDNGHNFGLSGPEYKGVNKADPVLEDDKFLSLGQPIAWATAKGFIPFNTKKVNQDRAVVKFGVNKDDGIAILGVLDGHGEFGHLVSGFIQEELVKQLELCGSALRTDPQGSITKAVATVVKKLAETKINSTFSGTTCVFCVKIDREVYTANIGDSRIIFCRRQASKRGIEPLPVSRDHKPEIPEERSRIEKAGGRVDKLPHSPGEDAGPYRVWLKNMGYPGLAMSRSLGDTVAASVGVSQIPEIIAHTIDDDDLFLVCASDGVWEFLTNAQVCEIVWNDRSNLRDAAEKLVKAATAKWQSQEEVVDDITCVIMGFNHNELPKYSGPTAN